MGVTGTIFGAKVTFSAQFFFAGLFGGDGADFLDGGRGNDFLDGGGGADEMQRTGQ